MGSIGKKLKKVVKKVGKAVKKNAKWAIPMAAIAFGGPALMSAMKGTTAAGGGLSNLLFGSLKQAAGGIHGPLKTAGWFGKGGMFQPLKGKLASGIMTGLKNPLSSKAGNMIYGGLGGLALSKLGGGEDKKGGGGGGGADLAQPMYNSWLRDGMNAGYSVDEINDMYAPYGEMYGGNYTTKSQSDYPAGDPVAQFPGTNYGHRVRRYSADGGSARPGFWLGGLLKGLTGGDPEDVEASENDPLRMTAEEEAAFNQIRNTINYMNANNLPVDPTEIMDLSGANLSDVDRELMQERVDAYLDPEQKANGGRIGLAGGGGAYESWKDFVEPLMIEFPELEGMSNEEQVEFLRSKGMIRDDAHNTGGRVGLGSGGMPEPSYKDVEERYAEGLTDREFIEFEMMSPEQRMEAMRNAGVLRANGGRIHKNIGGIMNAGSIPQTMQNPVDMNMQLDGRGGGFIPMGAKPKADDVPAMLSKDEFVMTRDAVKGMGGGDANVGAQRMYDLMNNLEAKA